MTQKSEKNDLDCSGQKDTHTFVTPEPRTLESLRFSEKKSKIQVDPFCTIGVMHSHIAFAVHTQ